ncbi:tail protein X [Aquipseudomonas alcaligenes]|uniref:Tail protein X n=1 Tax=Aquipseudomonas alcaligenes TaxID=43263 RepID=A0AA37FKB7_AQUAC|nr:tail protein X [Pseudomonas alcaligenes]MBX5565590.1 tail protein X [Pseudomonas aeruginosa]BCR26616.1 tail protein X [Pseudomonas alcaligenes]GIZ65788.1 tail protein X [Pseudomonas alcaligenes]GIZ70122.1 tail protein X [Pseudomonas alcaligenes]GIZ74475.1 tail protein X [Pseudomonas alcaligenes]
MAAVIASQGDTVDAICWRYYGRTAGVTELVLEANPGLADLGPIIPHGTPVTLPDAAPQAEQRQVLNLWD